jgi:carbamoyl-phosphate synthase large subunit
MINGKKSILVFGGSDYQLSLVKECKKMNLYTVVIDPNSAAEAQTYADAFEVIGGQDFEGTCGVVEKYNIDAIITAATDKPLVMMAQIAKKYGFEFISIDAATNCTDKKKMKEVFIKNNIPCAKFIEITEVPEGLEYPVVLKPKDNSGSRGVTICYNFDEAIIAIEDAKRFSKSEVVLCEEFVAGKEYSLESLHYNGKTKLLQITDKKMTELPYRCEMELTDPSLFSEEQFLKIEALIHQMAVAFGFNNCASHCEILVDGAKINVLEASGRMAGDYICSHLVPLSTGISMETAALDILLGLEPDFSTYNPKASGIYYFEYPEGVVKNVPEYSELEKLDGVVVFKFNLKEGDRVSKIKFGPDRYGYIILQAENRTELFKLKDYIFTKMQIEII